MTNNSTNKFTLSISVKPYVKRYLEINYGSPLDLASNPASHEKFTYLLKNPNSYQDCKISNYVSYYTETVDVMISEHDFYRYGWELTKTNTVAFNVYFERQVKMFMRLIVGTQIGLGMSINKSITYFQKKFSFPEDVWPYDSIYKDFYRNGYSEIVDFDNEIFNKFHKIIMRNLSDFRTLSKHAIQYYENNPKTQ